MTILPKQKKIKLRSVTVATKFVPARRSLVVRSDEDFDKIDYDTRLFVWKRDGGACCHCGSKSDLQYDHIIPCSLGGSGRAANVELLCGTCNNRKKVRLATPT